MNEGGYATRRNADIRDFPQPQVPRQLNIRLLIKVMQQFLKEQGILNGRVPGLEGERIGVERVVKVLAQDHIWRNPTVRGKNNERCHARI